MDSPVILITGAGKGIGEATVKELIARKKEVGNPRLVLVSRTRGDLEKLKKLSEENSLQCEFVVADLANNPLSALDLAIEKFGRLDILIHSAGVGRFGGFLDMTDADLEYVMKTNVEASFKLMQAAYRQLKTQSSERSASKITGTIVWVTSVAASTPFEQSSIYCMSKFAQKGLIEVMRLSARKDGIRIIDVKPGATLTPMWGEVSSEMKSKMMQSEDIATAIVDGIRLSSRACVEEISIRPIGGDL